LKSYVRELFIFQGGGGGGRGKEDLKGERKRALYVRDAGEDEHAGNGGSSLL